MKKRSYTRLLNETITIYEESGSLKAYQFMKEHAKNVEGNQAQLYNFQYALAAASDLKKEALGIMEEAIIDQGYWYAYEYLQADEDLDSLREFEKFQELVQLCKQREEKAMEQAKPALTVLNNEGEQERPVLMAVHGDQENAEMTAVAWNRTATKKYKLAFPQSSQIQFSDAYEWEDAALGVQEIQDHVNSLSSTEKLIIGGFSAGCHVALRAILEQRIRVDGFIFVAPWIPNIDEWRDAIDSLKNSNIKAYIICGEEDGDCLEGSKALSELLEAQEVAHELKIIQGLDHEYPEEFNEWLHRALQFINKRD